jgi:peptide/nickel transport system ATP-binding protein
MNDSHLLDVAALTVDYGAASDRGAGGTVHAVRKVSFSVSPGERVALIGESGSGKSTIVQALLGVLPSNARIEAAHVDVDGVRTQDGAGGIGEKAWNQLRRGRVAYVPQDPNIALNPVVRIGKQVAEAIRFAEPQVEKLDREARAVELLERVGLEDAERVHGSFPHQLSGGQRQRVLIAIALAGSPRLIVADEPTSGLDVEVQKRVLDLLDQIVEETDVAIVLVTHDLAVAARRTDRILVLRDGQVVERGATADVIAGPRAEYTRQLIDAVPRPRRGAVSRFDGAGGVDGSTSMPPAGSASPSAEDGPSDSSASPARASPRSPDCSPGSTPPTPGRCSSAADP